MKKKWIRGVLAVSVLVFGITACGTKEEKTEKKEEVQVSQETDAQAGQKEESEKEEPETDKDPAQGQEETAGTENPDELGAGTITVYSQNSDVTDFMKTEVELVSVTPQTILSELGKAGVLPSDVTIQAFSRSEKDGEQIIDLDLSEKFGTYMKEIGSAAEYYVIGSVCNTYLDAYSCEKIHITVNGEMLSTGHAEYPGYMSRFS